MILNCTGQKYKNCVCFILNNYSTFVLSFMKPVRHTKAYIALLFICITWGTTYLAIRVGVLHYPAFLFAGVRQFTAGLILMSIAIKLNKKTDFSRRNILRQILIGLLMITIGNGFVTWGEKYVPSG